MEGPLNPRVVVMRCRTSDRTSGAGEGAAVLGAHLGERLGVEPRVVGSPGRPRKADWSEDLAESRGCILEAGGQVDDALADGDMPLLLASDCTVCITTLPAVARHRPDARILWLDAHGDFNTPATTGSGFLGGMCLAAACGEWDAGLGGQIAPERVVLAGVRDLDGEERELLERSPVTVIGSSLETLVAVQNALDGAPVYVHLDVDVIDPEEMPAQFPAPGGLRVDKLYDLLEAVADECEVVGVEVTALQAPDRAPTVARVLEPLVGAYVGH